MSEEETKETEDRSSQQKKKANLPPKKPRKPPRKDLSHRPHRALSSFEFFAKEYKAEANKGVPADAAWKAMTDAEKEPYLVLGGKAAVLEQQRKNQIEFGEGYYVLEDGSKSTDIKNKSLSAKEQLEIRAKRT